MFSGDSKKFLGPMVPWSDTFSTPWLLLSIICACDLVRAQATYTACYIHVARLGNVVVFIVSHIILKATFKVVVIALLSSLLLNIGVM